MRKFFSYENEISSEDTISRFFTHLRSDRLNKCMVIWVKDISRIVKAKIIGIDERLLERRKTQVTNH
ncbi:MAG: hypothetical protein N4A49_15480 [Marinifilaceae bacterium]|nr:hypothetical protein [Marinifilaceae bacterium]